MTLAELLPDIRSLSKSDKLQLIQLLAAEVALEDDPATPLETVPIAIWSPYDSTDGAAVLLDLLDSEANRKR